MSRAIEVAEQPGGQTAYFAEDDALEGELRALASAEADCCEFLHFEIQRGDGRISLAVTGPTDARPVIEQLFAGGG